MSTTLTEVATGAGEATAAGTLSQVGSYGPDPTFDPIDSRLFETT